MKNHAPATILFQAPDRTAIGPQFDPVIIEADTAIGREHNFLAQKRYGEILDGRFCDRHFSRQTCKDFRKAIRPARAAEFTKIRREDLKQTRP